MASLRVRLPHTEAKSEFAIELRVGKKKIAARVQPLHQELIDPILIRMILTSTISRAQPEADEIEQDRRSDLEPLITAHPASEFLRQSHMLANVMPQSFNAVMSNHKPEFK
jgi:hypothetical protein